jgi:magnesium chelatase subunit D
MDYPFAALVGHEPMQTALLLNAVYPGIGGVLIRGERGTAKSTAARSLAGLLPPLLVVEGCPFHCDPAQPWEGCPHCSALEERRDASVPVPFVDLPLGATEDRVLGSLDFERVLREGRRAFQPGLLAAAHRGVLYIDEVNLLPDHLVDVLLDAAAMGVNTVQREGVSVIHPCRFLLIGTMNPEEGDLRPQLLDRFGLVVEVAAPRETAVRAEIVRRRLAFEDDSARFLADWQGEQENLRRRIVGARERLPCVAVPEGLVTFISQLCCDFEVDGLRADLTLHKTARARAAFHDREVVTLEDVRAAAEMVLPHRRKHRSFESPQRSREDLDQRLDEMERRRPQQSPLREQPDEENRGSGGVETDGQGTNPTGERLFEAAPAKPARRMEVESPRDASLPRGRRNMAASGERGRFVRAIRDERAADLAIGATVRAAAARGIREDGKVRVTAADLHRPERDGRSGTVLLFIVDASGSMAARRRMEAVKGAILGLLRSAYEQRDQVGVIAFRGPRAEVLLSPTNRVELAEQSLRELPTGGRTPLAHAFVLAGEVAQQARRAKSELPLLLILLSDGRANVPLPGTTGDPWRQALQAAEALAAEALPALVLDTAEGFVRLERVKEVAQALAAPCLPLEELSADSLLLKVRARS